MRLDPEHMNCVLCTRIKWEVERKSNRTYICLKTTALMLVTNLLSIPQLEKDGYLINYNTKRDWAVTTPEGKTLLFKKDVGICEGM